MVEMQKIAHLKIATSAEAIELQRATCLTLHHLLIN